MGSRWWGDWYLSCRCDYGGRLLFDPQLGLLDHVGGPFHHQHHLWLCGNGCDPALARGSSLPSASPVTARAFGLRDPKLPAQQPGLLSHSGTVMTNRYLHLSFPLHAAEAAAPPRPPALLKGGEHGLTLSGVSLGASGQPEHFSPSSPQSPR